MSAVPRLDRCVVASLPPSRASSKPSSQPARSGPAIATPAPARPSRRRRSRP